MALPVSINANTDMPPQNYFCGPFIDGNSNVYVFIRDSASGHGIEAWKATDPTDSFTEQDNAGNPADTSNGDPLVYCEQRGDTTYLATYKQDGDLNLTWYYHTFTTSDHGSTPDEWVIVDETIEAVADASANTELSISIVSRSDGTVVVIYNGDEDAVMGNPYARVDYNIRSSGGTWGGPVTLVADEKVEVDWFGAVAVLGESDKTHFFYRDAAANDAKHTSLTSGDSLSSIQDVDTTAGILTHVFGPGVYFDDGGVERIRVPYVNASGDKVSVGVVDDDGTPSKVEDIGTIPRRLNSWGTMCFAVDGTTVHLLYSKEDGAEFDLYHNQADTPQGASDWGTETEFLDAVTINRISCNVIDRSGKKLAMVYDNAGTIQYNEKDIAVVGTDQEVLHRPKLSQSLLTHGSVH